jgi:polysaccharide export outer membrane protein
MMKVESAMARRRRSGIVVKKAACFVLILLCVVVCGLAAAPAAAQNRAAGSAPPPTGPASSGPINSGPINGPGAGTSGQPGAVAPVDTKTYVIGPEDVLFVRVWREQDFTGAYPVRPDGKITIPLVGDVQAAGLTPVRLGENLKEALSAYINSPDVSVSLQTVNSKKYYITGEVNRPGEYALVTPTRVFDALSNAGGFRDFANKKKIIIIRGASRFKFNYNDILKGKNLEQNIFIENGDTIVVP